MLGFKLLAHLSECVNLSNASHKSSEHHNFAVSFGVRTRSRIFIRGITIPFAMAAIHL
uniref:Uncharacterized protein n=1 Tax=Hyaloperonospora arabidopsidis (strain Emoy2) TaxID=559515 RepID=M4B5C6_HYAAE